MCTELDDTPHHGTALHGLDGTRDTLGLASLPAAMSTLTCMVSRASSPSEQQLAVASMRLSDYSVAISTLMEQVIATSTNHDVVVLSHLAEHPAQRPQQLKALTGLSRPGVAAVVARLERLGLVQRSPGEGDHRTTLASLTPRGRRRMAEFERALEQHFVTSAPLVAEILLLLGHAADVAPVRGPADTAMAVIGRLGAAGASHDALIDGRALALPLRQRMAVSALMAWGPSRPTQLAESLGVSSGGATYVMDQMESHGLITRTYGHADDRRAVVIQLSKKGVAYGRSMCAALAASAPAVCAALSLTLSAWHSDSDSDRSGPAAPADTLT